MVDKKTKKTKEDKEFKKLKKNFSGSLFVEINNRNCDISIKLLDSIKHIIETSIKVLKICSEKMKNIDISEKDTEDRDNRQEWEYWNTQYNNHIKFIRDAANTFKSVQPDANRELSEIIAKQLSFFRGEFEKRSK